MFYIPICCVMKLFCLYTSVTADVLESLAQRCHNTSGFRAGAVL